MGLHKHTHTHTFSFSWCWQNVKFLCDPHTCPAPPPAGSKQHRLLCSPVRSAPWLFRWRRAQSPTPPPRGHLEVLWGHTTFQTHCILCIAKEKKNEANLLSSYHFDLDKILLFLLLPSFHITRRWMPINAAKIKTVWPASAAWSDLKVVMWYDDGATAGDVCTGFLAVSMRVISLPHVLVGCT